MIVERARFQIAAGHEPEFEADFERAKGVIAEADGFLGLSLLRGIERPDEYTLLVRWQSVEDHMVGFREGPLYVNWGGLLRPHFAAPPEVEHGRPVAAEGWDPEPSAGPA